MNAVCLYYLHVLQETSEAGSKTSESLFVLLFTIFFTSNHTIPLFSLKQINAVSFTN